MDNEISYRYFKSKNQKNKIISVGYKARPYIDLDGIQVKGLILIEYAVGLCGSKDSFSRKRAREVINRRFDICLTQEFIVSNSFGLKSIPDLIKTHYNSLVKNDLNSFERDYFGLKQFPAWSKYIK